MLDLLIVTVFVLYCIANGFLNQKKASQNLEEYFLGGRTLKGWQAGFSMAATQFAADTPLLVTGLIATAGVFSLWRLWIYAFAFLLMGFVLGGSWRRSRVLTDAQLTEIRYGGRGATALRVLKALYMGVLVNCTVLAMVLVAAVRVAEPFLTWHLWLDPGIINPLATFLESINFSLTAVSADHAEYWLRSADNFITIGLIVGFTTLYSMTGGLRSVVATDVLQFALAMIGTLAYAWIVISQAGGLVGLNEKLAALYTPDTREALLSFAPGSLHEVSWVVLAVIAVQWFAQVNADGTGYLAQRTMACATDRDAKMAAVIFTFGQILIRSLLWILIGVGMLVLYPAAQISLTGETTDAFRIEREMTFVFGMRDLLPPGFLGLMLTGMIAALASTLDTHLNWGASYLTNDVYKGWLMEKWKKRNPGGRELVWVARLAYIVIIMIATVITVNLGSIQGAWHLTLLFGSGLGVVLILRWLWWRINLWSEVTAIVVSFGLSFFLLFATDLSEGVRLLTMVAVSTVAVVGVTLLTPAEKMEKLAEFYRQVRPLGFWRPVAKACSADGGEDARRLASALGAMITCAICVFFLLVGTGRLLLHGFKDEASIGLSVVFVIGGLALIPIWCRLGFKEE